MGCRAIENDNKRTQFYISRFDIDMKIIQEQIEKKKQEIQQREKENKELGILDALKGENIFL